MVRDYRNSKLLVAIARDLRRSRSTLRRGERASSCFLVSSLINLKAIVIPIYTECESVDRRANHA